MKHLVTMAEQKGCHGNIPVPVTHGDTGAKGGVRMCGTCKRWWGDPGYRVPTGRWHDNEEEHGMTTRKWCNHEHLIQHTCIRSTNVVSGLYLRSVHSGRNAFEVEVVVHGVIMEVVVLATVVVHGRRGTWHHII